MIYNNFLYYYIRNEIDLQEETFKVALFNSNYTPTVEDETYTKILLSGGEISGTGYTKGGNTIQFTGPIELITDNNIYYKGSSVIWENATFYGARYAVVYRVTEEKGKDILISFYDFGVDRKVEKGTFKVSWGDNYALSIALNNLVSGGIGGSGYIGVDRDLSKISTNPLQNKSTTEALGTLGVRFEDEEVPDFASVIEEDVDILKKITAEDIEYLINYGEYPEPSPTPDPSPTTDIDSELSYDSDDALKNKTITEAFASMGVVLNDEGIPDKASAVDGHVDSLTEVTKSEIDAIFNKETSIVITYIPVGFEDQSFIRSYKVNQSYTLPGASITGYNLLGWYSNSKCTQPYYVGIEGDPLNIKKNATLYGKLEIV